MKASSQWHLLYCFTAGTPFLSRLARALSPALCMTASSFCWLITFIMSLYILLSLRGVSLSAVVCVCVCVCVCVIYTVLSCQELEYGGSTEASSAGQGPMNTEYAHRLRSESIHYIHYTRDIIHTSIQYMLTQQLGCVSWPVSVNEAMAWMASFNRSRSLEWILMAASTHLRVER